MQNIDRELELQRVDEAAAALAKALYKVDKHLPRRDWCAAVASLGVTEQVADQIIAHRRKERDS